MMTTNPFTYTAEMIAHNFPPASSEQNIFLKVYRSAVVKVAHTHTHIYISLIYVRIFIFFFLVYRCMEL